MKKCDLCRGSFIRRAMYEVKLQGSIGGSSWAYVCILHLGYADNQFRIRKL